MASGLECPVCLDVYSFETDRRPMSLSCGHTMCLDCISNMPVKICPTCRAVITSQVPNFTLRDAMLAFAAKERLKLPASSPAKTQSKRSIQVQAEAIAAQLATKQAELNSCEVAAALALKYAASFLLAVGKARTAVDIAQEALEQAEKAVGTGGYQVMVTSDKVVAVKEDIRLLTAALLPLTLSISLSDPDQKGEPSQPIILVTTENLEDVLLQMSKSNAPATYDFQGKTVKYSKKTNPTLRSDTVTWRNGMIVLGEKLRLDITGTSVVIENFRVTGGGGMRVLDGGALNLTECKILDAISGLSLEGNAKVVANKLNITNCSMTGILMEGSSSLVSKSVSVNKCVWTGIGIHGSSSLKATRLKISDANDGITLAGTCSAELINCVLEEIREDGIWMTGSSKMVGKKCNVTGVMGDVLRLKDTSKMKLEGCNLTGNTGSPGVVMESSKLTLISCTIEGDFIKDDTATVKVQG